MAASAINVKHEPASQRLHFRVTSPAEVEIGGRRYPTENWSVGGFKIVRFDGSAEPGERIPIQFGLNFQGFDVSFEANAEVLRREGDTLAAQFIGLGERESELLRTFVSNILSGQMVGVDGVLKNLDRPVTKTPISVPAAGSAVPRKHTIRRFVVAFIYLVVGLVLAGYTFLTVAGLVMRVNVETAVTSAPLEQVVSMDIGTIRELNVQPGAEVQAGQQLFRVENETTIRAVEAARQEIQSAEIDVRQTHSATESERAKLATYQSISKDQLEAGVARINALVAVRDEARAEAERAKQLYDYRLVSKQVYDAQQATVVKHDANVQQAIADQRIAENTVQTVNKGYFFSGNFLVGDLATRIAEEDAAQDKLKVAQAALGDALKHESQRVYRAPFQAVVMRVFKSSGMTVDRGENLMVLRRKGESAYIDAYLTQEEAGLVGTGTRAVAFIPARGKRYQAEVIAVDRTSGFLKEVQTPKLQQSQFGWRNTEDRSAYVKLVFVDVTPAELSSIAPGLPVRLTIPKKRDGALRWLPNVHAASGPEQAPRLWPAQSPLFSREGVRDSNFEPVRRQVLEAADHALRKPAAPVETIHSAGVTDKSSPELLQSRRAFQDADNFVLLALAFKLTGKGAYREAARDILNAWAHVNKPTGNPVDEVRLQTFLWGIDLMGAEVESAPVKEWLTRWQAADRNWKFGPNTETNNHKTHHLATLLMLDRALGRTDDYERDLQDADRQLKANLSSADGKSLDCEQRDAMHYHIFDLESWIEIGLVTGRYGPNLDRAFSFFEKNMREHPEHLEFQNSSAPIDAKRAAGGFDYAKPQPYDMKKAARAIFAYATLPGRHVSPPLWETAAGSSAHSDLFYQARYYVWQSRN